MISVLQGQERMMFSEIKSTIKGFNWRLWLVLAVTLLIPASYQTVRIYFLGDLPTEWGVNIASQLVWVDLLYEILEEALILPLFYLLGKSSGSKSELESKARTGIVISGGVYAVLSLIIIVFAGQLCEWMAVDQNTIGATAGYIRLESIASTIGIISKFVTVLFVTIEKERFMYLLLIIRTVMTVVLDTLLISGLPFSADMGVNGIAVTNISVSVVCVVVSFICLKKENINIFRREKADLFWLREYGKIGAFSGAESFIRNIAFMLMVSRMVNVISESGTYWVANSFIWTWLLLPTQAMYDVVKKETAGSKENIRIKTGGYFAASVIFSLVWLVSVPVWEPFIRYVLNNGAYKTIVHLVLISTPFYIVYIFNCVLDGTIYGRGKTSYMLIESIFTNGLYYTTMFILWKNGIWTPSLEGIALMFGTGMAVDFLPTLACYLYLLKKEGIICNGIGKEE